MSYYQQTNNTSISSIIQVSFLNVTYINIVEDSNIHKLISRLVVAQKEFQKCIKWGVPVSETKSKALELSSILEALMDISIEVAYEKRKELSEKIIKSSCAVIKQYNEALSIDGFEENIVKELKDYTQNFFEQNFGKVLDSDFWFKLKCYEWLLKEGFITEHQNFYPNSEYSFIFDKEDLEDFFVKNRNAIIKLMLANKKDYDGLIFNSPLSNTETHQSYSLLCEITESTQA
ncbi:hypothetical protein ACVTNV_004616 [Vibrio alginolyticus]